MHGGNNADEYLYLSQDKRHMDFICGYFDKDGQSNILN